MKTLKEWLAKRGLVLACECRCVSPYCEQNLVETTYDIDELLREYQQEEDHDGR